MDIINIKINLNEIIIRFTLSKYYDDLNIIKNENDLLIIEVKYSDIVIKENNNYFDLRALNVDRLVLLNNDDIELYAFNVLNYDIFYYPLFSSNQYHWRIIDIISEKEYLKYNDIIYEQQDKNIINDLELPIWAQIK